MKKMWILIIGILTTLIIAGCTSVDNTSENYVSPATILKDIEAGKTFTFAIVDKDCSACQAYKKGALKEIEEYKEGSIRYIEINGIQSKPKELSDIETLIEDHLDDSFEATPTTYFMKDGELKEVIVGAVSYDELLEAYEENNEETE